MNEHVFDRVTRTAASAVSRRASVLAFGGAALTAAIANHPDAEAAQNTGTKRVKKKLKKVKRRFARACAAQAGQCQESVDRFCATQGLDQAKCLQDLSPCCTLITGCDARAGLSCVFDAFTPDP